MSYNFYYIQERIYQVYVSDINFCELYSTDNPRKLMYEPEFNIQLILSDKIEKLLPRTVKFSDLGDYNRDYDIKIICEIKGENKELYVQMFGRKELFYEMEIIHKLQPNNKYIIKKFRKTKRGGIIITSDGKRYWISKEVMKILEKYFSVRENLIICYYNQLVRIPKLTLITGDEIILNDNTKILYQSLELEICNKKFKLYINKSNFIDFNKEGLYNFMLIYNFKHSMLYAYEYLKDKYYCLTYKERKILLDNIDQEITKIFNDVSKEYTYNYLIDKDKNILSFIIKVNENKTISVELNKMKISFETMLDITKLEPRNLYETVPEQEVYDKPTIEYSEENGPTIDFDAEINYTRNR